MDRGQATQRVSSECVHVFGFHKGCVSPDRVDGTDEDVVVKSHVIRQVRRQIVGDDGEEWSIRKGNERVWVFRETDMSELSIGGWTPRSRDILL